MFDLINAARQFINAARQFEKAIKELQKVVTVEIKPFSVDIKLEIYTPCFYIQEFSLIIVPLKKYLSPKFSKSYYKPMFYRKCFMCLKTFVNLRFK